MGCGKSREVQEIVIKVADEDAKAEEESGNQGKVEKIFQVYNEKSEEAIERYKPVETFIEVGKIGEDGEAGVIQKGKKIDESIDQNLIKHILPKRLPPISHPPIPSTLISKFTKQSAYVPNKDIIKQLLPTGNKGFDFEFIGEVSSEQSKEKLIKNIMQELSLDNKM